MKVDKSRYRTSFSRILIFSMLALIIFNVSSFGQECRGQNAEYYEQNGYKINEVRVATRNRTLFDFQGKALNDILKGLLSNEGIPVESGKPLKALAVKQASRLLKDKVSELARNTKGKFNIPFVLPAIECNSTNKTVDIVFYIRLFNDEKFAEIQSKADQLKELKKLPEKIHTEEIKDQEILSDRLELIAQDIALKAKEELAVAKAGGDGEKIQKLIKGVETAEKVYKGVRRGYRTIKFINNFRIYPFASDADSGGIRFGVTANIRVFPKNPVLKRFVAKVQPWGDSSEYAFYFKGDKKTDNAFFRNNEWSFGYVYDRNDFVKDDVRLIGANRQREFGAYNGKTKKVGDADLTFRYAFQYERVNQLLGGVSNGLVLAESVNPATNHSNVKYNNYKVAFGSDMKFDRLKLNSTYGFQFGQGDGTQMDNFKKHIFNIDADVEYARDYHTVINFGYGKISADGSGLIPITERFYGNSDAVGFLLNGWDITENPSVRSLRTYDFASALGTNYYGGEAFSSINTTTYIPIWHKNPFRDAAKDLTARGKQIADDFVNLEKAELENTKESLRRLYLNSLPAILQYKVKLESVKNDVEDVVKTLKEMKEKITDPALKQRLGEAIDVRGLRLANAIKLLIDIFRSDENIGERLTDFLGQAVKNDSLIQNMIADVELLGKDIVKLKPEIAPGTGARVVDSLQARLNNQVGILKQTAADALAQFKDIEQYIKGTVAPDIINAVRSPKNFFGYMVKKTDAVNVDGVFLFDAGRLQQHSVWSPWKTGIGGGGKLHFFFIDVMAGYMWNVNRKQGEDRGRFIIRIDFADLFQ